MNYSLSSSAFHTSLTRPCKKAVMEGKGRRREELEGSGGWNVGRRKNWHATVGSVTQGLPPLRP